MDNSNETILTKYEKMPNSTGQFLKKYAKQFTYDAQATKNDMQEIENGDKGIAFSANDNSDEISDVMIYIVKIENNPDPYEYDLSIESTRTGGSDALNKIFRSKSELESFLTRNNASNLIPKF